MRPGWSLDLTTTAPDGQEWDFTKASRRHEARKLLDETKPKLLIGSPMCTAFSVLQRLSEHKRDPEVVRKMRVEAEMHLAFCCELYEAQLKRGDYFLHEHPASASSWQCRCVKRVMAIPGVIATTADQCRYGLTAVDERGPGLVRKSTRFLTNAPCIAAELSRKCKGNHRHVHLVNGRAAAAQVYPRQLCAAVCRGAKEQLRRRRRPLTKDQQEINALLEKDRLEEYFSRHVLDPVDMNTMMHEGEACWDDSKGGWLDPSKVGIARTEEMEFVNRMKVYDKVPRSECPGKPIPVRWVDTNKGTEAQPNYRSRIVAQELKSRNPGDPAELYAAMPPLEAVKYIISHAASGGRKKRDLMVIDVRRAYFNAPARREVFVEIPPEDWEPGDEAKCARLRSSLYGTRDAARNWEEELRKFLESIGGKVGVASTCVYSFGNKDVKAAVHGDDLILSGQPEELEWIRKEFTKRFEIRVQVLSDGNGEIKILNRIIRKNFGGITIEADPRHVEAIIEQLGLAGAKGLSTPCEVEKERRRETPHLTSSTAENEEEDVSLDFEQARRYRGIAARLNYLAQDRPDLKFAALKASRNMSNPRDRDWGILKRVGRYLITRPRAICSFRWQDESSTKIWACSDSDWAGDKKTRKSTTGGCLWHGAHLLKVWAKTQKAISLSSAEAELYAAVHCASEALGVQSILKDLGKDAAVGFGMDASAALALINREGLGKARHVETQWLWIQKAVREGRLQVSKIHGELNPADLMTKPLCVDKIDEFMKKMSYTFV